MGDKVKLISNDDYPEMTKGKVYYGEFGRWCLVGGHLVFTLVCQEHNYLTLIGYRFINDDGEVDFAWQGCFDEVNEEKE